jgi:hypothetical protein
MNEVCDYLLGSIGDEGLSPTAGLDGLSVLANQDGATDKIGAAIKEGFEIEAEAKSEQEPSPTDILKAALTNPEEEPKEDEKKVAETEDIKVILAKKDVSADPKDSEAFAKAAFAAARKEASETGLEIEKDVQVEDKGEKIEVTMVGRKVAEKEEKTVKTASSRTEERKKLVEAQFGGGEGGMGAPGMEAGGPMGGGGTTMPAQPVPDTSMDPGVGALTEEPDDTLDSTDDNPESLPPGSICPICGSDDVDVENGEIGCRNCGGKGEIEVNIKMKSWPDTIIQKDLGETGPEEDEGIGPMEGGEGIEMPEIGVATVMRITPEMVKTSGAKPVGSFCPRCGSDDTEVKKTSGSCHKCQQRYRAETLVDNDSAELIGRVAWRDLGVSRIAMSRATEKQARNKAASANKADMEARLDALNTALKARGWTDKFAKANIEAQAHMIAQLADDRLLPKN